MRSVCMDGWVMRSVCRSGWEWGWWVVSSCCFVRCSIMAKGIMFELSRSSYDKHGVAKLHRRSRDAREGEVRKTFQSYIWPSYLNDVLGSSRPRATATNGEP